MLCTITNKGGVIMVREIRIKPGLIIKFKHMFAVYKAEKDKIY